MRKSLTVSNESALALNLSAEIVDEKGAPLPGASLKPSLNGNIAPGATIPVSLAAPASAVKGSLVIVAAPAAGLPTGAVLRVPFTRASPVKAAVTEWTLIRRHAGDDSGALLPLTGPCASLGIEDSKELGAVQTGGEDLEVSGSCDADEPKSLSLEAPDEHTNGRTYKGTIAIGDSAVALTVEDTISGPAVALLIFIGIIAALALSGWREGWRARSEGQREADLVEAMIDSRNPANADLGFATAAKQLELPDNVLAWTIASAVREELTRLRGILRFPATADEVKTARKETADLDLEVRTWAEFANRVKDLHTTMPRLAALTAYRKRISTNVLDLRDQLTHAQMTSAKGLTEEAIGLARDWPAEEVRDAQAMALKLDRESPARIRFNTLVKERLPTIDEGEEVRVAIVEFRDAYDELRKEVRRKGIQPDTPRAGAVSLRPKAFEPVSTPDPADAARDIATRIFTLDLLVLIALLGVAIIAGLKALWVGQSFGGWWDILAALAWGLGSGLVGPPLVAAVGDLGRSWVNTKGAT